MAKSIRSKQKMAQRRKKRESGNYHAADAARVARLSARLLGKGKAKEEEEDKVDQEGDEAMVDEQEAEPVVKQEEEDGETQSKNKVSTSAPRGSRRENYRSSKGMKVKQGKVAATGRGGGKRAFKPSRRR